MSEWVDVLALDALPAGAPFAAIVDGKALALFRIGEEIFALQDACPHGHARLSEGFIVDGMVECPLHQGLICLRTGAPKSPFIRNAAATYPVRIAGGRVEVRLDAPVLDSPA